MDYSLDQYQKDSRKTAIYPEIGDKIIYPTLGLAGETGEVVDKIKKIFRDKKGVISDEDKDSIKKELGDVLWYLSQSLTELGLNLSEVAKGNIDKLMARMENNTLQGSGDNR